jgi:anti-sigma B factor antagonist
MTFKLSRHSATCVLDIQGELDAVSVPEIKPVLGRITRARPSKLLVDLSGLRLIDSLGVGAIVSLFKTVRSYQGEVTVLGASDQPLAILQLLRLDRVLMPPAVRAT